MIPIRIGDLVAIASAGLGLTVDQVLDELDEEATVAALEGAALDGIERDQPQRCAARLLMRLIALPPLPQAAGRIAILVTLQFLGLNGLRLVRSDGAHSLVSSIREGKVGEDEVTSWIAHNTVATDDALAGGEETQGSEGEEDLIRLYLAEIGQFPLLSEKDEVRLAKAIETGNEARLRLDSEGVDSERRGELLRLVREGETCEQAFIRSNLRLVTPVADRYRSVGLPMLDLVQEGNLGLMHALETFDWRKGVRFSTWATPWIERAIARGIRKATGRLERPPAREGLAAEEKSTDLEPEGSKPELESSKRADGTSLLDHEVARLLEPLEQEERDVLLMRFGLDREEPRSLEEVAEALELNREDVYQIEARAMEKLRKGPSPGPSDAA